MRTYVEGPAAGGPYSPGVIAEGRLLLVSGQVAARHGAPEYGTVEEETRIVLENLGSVLRAAGASYADVVRCGVYLAEIEDFDKMNSVYSEFFPEPRPARTTIGVALAGSYKVEIDCIAVLSN